MTELRFTNTRTLVIALVIAGFFLFVYGVGDRDLWAPDEDEYAQISREMIRTGNWLYPTCNGIPWTIKPALYNWLVGFISLPYGDVDEFRARIFSALAAIGTILLTFFMGRRAFSPRAGFIAALALGTSVLFLENGRWAQTYMLSTFFATLAIFMFHRGYSDPGKRTSSYLWMCAAAGLGVLTMGPVNLAIPGLVIFVYLVVMKDLKHILKMKLVWGTLIFAAIALSWYIPAGMRSDYGSDLLITTNVTRFLNTWTHNRPFHYYAVGLLWAFLPWSLFLPGAIHLAFSRRSEADRKNLKLLLVWVFALLLFFSLAQCKRHQYILGLYPGLALLMGYLGHRALDGWKEKYFRRSIVIPALIFAGILLLVTVALPVGGSTQYPEFLGLGIAASLVTGTFAVLLFVAWRRNSPRALIFLPAAFMGVLVLLGVHVLIPAMNVYKTPKPFCEEIAARLEQGGEWVMYKHYRAAFVYYTDSFVEEIKTEQKLKAFMERPTFSMAVVGTDHYATLEDDYLKALPEITRKAIGHREFVLIANREEP